MNILPIESADSEALFLEPRKFFDAAIMGASDSYKYDQWDRYGHMKVVVYNSAMCIEAIEEWLDTDHEEALEYFCYNTLGAYGGLGTPIFLSEPEIRNIDIHGSRE